MPTVDLTQLYETMSHHMGPSGWWPSDTKSDIIVGAILVQNTYWKNAGTSLNNIKTATQMDAKTLLALSQDDLIDLIRPSGFYKNKSKAIHNVFQWFEDRNWDYHQIWADNRATLRQQLLKLPGVGNETADDYLVYIFDQPDFIADTYARRLFAHLGYEKTDSYPHLKQQITLPKTFTFEMAQDFHGLIDEFGKQYLQHEGDFETSFLVEELPRLQTH